MQPFRYNNEAVKRVVVYSEMRSGCVMRKYEMHSGIRACTIPKRSNFPLVREKNFRRLISTARMRWIEAQSAGN